MVVIKLTVVVESVDAYFEASIFKVLYQVLAYAILTFGDEVYHGSKSKTFFEID